MKYIKTLLFISFLVPALPSLAQSQEAHSSVSHPVAIVMLSVIGLLAFVILLMGNVMLSSHAVFKKRAQNAGKIITPLLVLIFTLAASSSFAQESAAPAAPSATDWVSGLSNTAMIFLISIIVLELIIIFYMVSVFRSFTKLHKIPGPGVEVVKKKKWSWLEKFNNTRTVDAKSEDEYNLGHDYDGIEELDNPTPPWWQWGFVASGVFAVIYMWVYFVSYSAPNQFQELEIANARAEEKVKNYMASSANKIDENTVTYLDDATDLGEGQRMFVANCAACHGADGGGTVGPNLTDKYWLHGGSINDIFKTIKYGVPEKGMKSWKDDFTPKQIAQLASFVHSLEGTTPAAPKEAQGDLYGGDGEASASAEANPADSAAAVK